MSDDFSLLRFDIDEAAMRSILDALGVSPAQLDAFDDADSTESTSPTAPPSTDRRGPRVGETPPPGAGEQVPADAADDEASGRRRTLLLAGAGGAVLAVVAAVGAVLYRRRSDAGDLPTPDFPTPDLDRVTGAFGDDEDADETVPTSATDRDRPDSTVDVAPLVGMAALAVGGTIIRTIRSE